ncbi:MAG: HAD family hydrolase [Acidobacteriaceae bacterium]|nr:HAD family hydrolase [Acidobacteriaceae bacterium]
MPDPKLVFLFDVDNTLLDNDQVTADLRKHLDSAVGSERSRRYWELFETIRKEIGYADYLGALQRYRAENPHESQLVAVSYFLLGYPFANRLFPGSLDAVQHVSQWGTPVILSDGDVVFQPRKVFRSGLFERFAGNVQIYIHKEEELDDVAAKFPADHYVMIDDKLRLLTAIKDIWRSRVTTVFVRQGHYAHDTKAISKYRDADLTIERIGDLTQFEAADFCG